MSYTNWSGNIYYTSSNSTTSTGQYYTINNYGQYYSKTGYSKPKTKQDFKNAECKWMLQKERGW